MVAYRGYLRGLVASKVDARTDDLASALIAIHDEDPEALTLEEIASICSRSVSPATRRRTT